MEARPLGEPVCVSGREAGTSALRLRFLVSDDVTEPVKLVVRPSKGVEGAKRGRPARVWQDRHVVVGVEVPSDTLRRSQELIFELWTESSSRRLWKQQAQVEQIDDEYGLHYLSLSVCASS